MSQVRVSTSLQAERSAEWYRARVRPFMERFSPQRLDPLDENIDRIDALKARIGEECAVCFLGHSGVGKSTLVNTLIGDTTAVLPQGGIGPLTAQATCVRYAPHHGFTATYVSAEKLNQIRSKLEDLCGSSEPGFRPEPDSIEAPDYDQAEGDAEDAKQLTRTASLLIRGKPADVSDFPYLVDCIRAALQMNSRFARDPQQQDLPRIERIHTAVELARRGASVRATSTESGFREFLRHHVSGHLSPLVDTLEVGVSSDLLRDGLTVVDLPGLGISHDQYRRVTQTWVRERAKAVVLVVDRSGITQESADLLRASGFFSRLAHAAHDPSVDPVQLFLIAVKVDLSATDAWREERSDNPETARDWVSHFAVLQSEMKARIQSEVALHLRHSMDDTESDYVLKSLTDGMSVHCVSAEEFRKLLAGDTDDPARIQDASQSGIPDVRAELARLVKSQDQALRARVVDASDQFVDRVLRSVETVRLECSDTGRSRRAIKKLRKELDRFLDDTSDGPRRLLRSYQASFQQFLDKETSERILEVVREACLQAERSMKRYLRDLGFVHWSTLRATVRRGGTFVTGSAWKIDLPNEFAMRLEEALAIRWSKDVLGLIRDRALDYGKQCTLCIERVVAWGEEQEDTRIEPERVRALMAELSAGQPDIEAALNAALKKGSDLVRERLLEELLSRVAEKCAAFCRSGMHMGTGTKVRILDFFGELVPECVDAARDTSHAIFTSSARSVAERVSRLDYSLRLEMASESLVASRRTRLQQDDEERARALQIIPTIVASDPRKHRWGVQRIGNTAANTPAPLSGRRRGAR